jgi:hypothetical protein
LRSLSMRFTAATACGRLRFLRSPSPFRTVFRAFVIISPRSTFNTSAIPRAFKKLASPRTEGKPKKTPLFNAVFFDSHNPHGPP